MARIYPFRALRYNPSLVRLEDVVTQPYDKITPEMQQAYYQQSPYNLVRIVLGLPELFDEPGVDDVYTRAARDFHEWRRSGILTQEKEPCVFAYAQRFAVPGNEDVVLDRRGFIALGELYDYSQNVVFRHEQTLLGPKSDRLKLLRATQAHFGQIFMLYSDPGLTAEKILYSGATGPEFEVVDEFGVTHRVWQVSDMSTINILIGSMEDKKLIIADGHHRYETALAYSREKAPQAIATTERNLANSSPQPAYPGAAAMMTFVNMDSTGIRILPTHRVVFGLADFDPGAFLHNAEALFELVSLGDEDVDEMVQRLAKTRGAAFVAITQLGRHLMTARPDAVARALARLPERQRKLDLVQLHALVIEQLLGITHQATLEGQHLRYVRDPAEAMDQIWTGNANVVFLTKPVTLEQLREVAFAGEVMPQKSTDFYPKLLSGLAIYAMD